MAIFFFCALIDPFQHGWNTLYFFQFLSSNNITEAYSEMANHWCLVMWPREARITAQPFVPLYLADNLFEVDTDMNEITVSLHKHMFLTTQKSLSCPCLEKAFCTLISWTRLLHLIRCDLWTFPSPRKSFFESLYFLVKWLLMKNCGNALEIFCFVMSAFLCRMAP